MSLHDPRHGMMRECNAIVIDERHSVAHGEGEGPPVLRGIGALFVVRPDKFRHSLVMSDTFHISLHICVPSLIQPPDSGRGFVNLGYSIHLSFSNRPCLFRPMLGLAAGVQLRAVFALIVKEPCVAMSYQALHNVAGKSIPGRTPKYAGVHSASSSSQGSA